VDALVVQIEVSYEAAKLLEGLAVRFQTETDQRLTGILAVHTRTAVETQKENVDEAVRALERGLANPVSVEVQPPA
jgi:hypothetical protein